VRRRWRLAQACGWTWRFPLTGSRTVAAGVGCG